MPHPHTPYSLHHPPKIGLCPPSLPRLGLWLLIGAAALTLSGCATLLQLIGSPVDYATCQITGTVVGADGQNPGRLDLKWEPDDTLSTSTDLIRVRTEGNTFTITGLAIAQDAARVEGEIAVGELPIPPRPRRYDPVDFAIDLPKTNCTRDLGTITLPLD